MPEHLADVAGVNPVWRWTTLVLLAGVAACIVVVQTRPPPPLPVAEPVAEVSPPRPAADPRLDRPVDRFDMDHVPLADALRRASATFGMVVRVEVDNPTRVPPGIPVTVHVRRPTLRQVLDATVGSAESPDPLGWVERGGQVVVTTRGAAEAASAVTRAYDVRPLVRELVDGRATLGPIPTRPTCFSGPGVAPTMPEDECVDAVRQTIVNCVDPPSWEENGGRVGSFSYLNGKLIVTQSVANQGAVERLLDRLARH